MGIDCPLIKVPFDNRSMNKVTRIDIHFSDIQKFVSSSPVFEKSMSIVITWNICRRKVWHSRIRPESDGNHVKLCFTE